MRSFKSFFDFAGMDYQDFSRFKAVYDLDSKTIKRNTNIII